MAGGYIAHTNDPEALQRCHEIAASVKATEEKPEAPQDAICDPATGRRGGTKGWKINEHKILAGRLDEKT